MEVDVSSRRFAVAPDGARLAYDVAGAGEPVVCIQGVGIIGRGWLPQAEVLASRFTVIAPDNRDIGDSSAGSAPLTIEQMAADVIMILDAESIGTAHLVGHSMGGLIALAAALSQPSRIRSLSLLCTFANGADATRLSARMLTLGLRTRLGTPAMRRNAMLEMIMPGDYLDRVDRGQLARRLADLFGHDLADQPPVAMRQLRAMTRLNVEGRLHELRDIPALIACGAHDPIARPASSRAMSRRMPHATFIEFSDASHALPIQCADRINSLLIDHLTAAGRAAAAPGGN
jgi:3-oxoadipate enol-lactonase